MTDDLGPTRSADFWEAIYDVRTPPWDLDGPHPTLQAASALGLLRDHERILVPGAGYGHDALFLAESGHRVTAVDFALPAVRQLERNAAERGLTVDARQTDIFELFDEPPASFDAVFEYTCFCAIDPALRPRYRDLVSHLVRPGGRLLMLAFPVGRLEPGPPHNVDLAEVDALFSVDWRRCLHARPRTTPKPRAHLEHLLLFDRLDDSAPTGDRGDG